jgi:uncharacterized protein (DUF2249 family)/iron-sulfur cluster repair protein YtfE (RIC family)
MTITATEAYEAMMAHHARLGEELARRADSVSAAVAAGRPYGAGVAGLIAYLAEEVLPHAAAEEKNIYPAAAAHADMAGMVGEMIAEHVTLSALGARLAAVADPASAAGQAQQVATLFAAHAAKENDVLLPALLGDKSVDLAVLLEQMHSGIEQAHDPGSAPAAGGTHETAAPEDSVLDVRELAPARRHETIFAAYRDLAPGAGFLLLNDHDPKPLRYQFEAEHAGQFTWDYLESGPEVWRARIGRPRRVARAEGRTL